jgi:hypothetical protein
MMSSYLRSLRLYGFYFICLNRYCLFAHVGEYFHNKFFFSIIFILYAVQIYPEKKSNVHK